MSDDTTYPRELRDGSVQTSAGGHHWYRDKNYEEPKVDVWRLDVDRHNGPMCRMCNEVFCEHCEPGCYNEPCELDQDTLDV